MFPDDEYGEISAIVCVRNGEKTLNTCMKSISANNPSEIIVIDGNSSDSTVDIARTYTDKIFCDEGKGLAYARQLGAEKARAKYIAYIDSDVELPASNILSTLMNQLERLEWAAVHPVAVDPDAMNTYWERGESLYWQGRINKTGEKEILPALCCLIRRDLVINQKFDPFFSGAVEDSEFFYRLSKLGYTFGTIPLEVYHHHRSTLLQFIRQKVWFGKGGARFFWKYRRPSLLMVPVLISLEGTLFSIRFKKPFLAPYFLLWSVIYSWGFLIGLFDLLLKSGRNRNHINN